MAFFDDEELDVEAIKEKFFNGDYDEQMYVNPTLTKELKYLISRDNDYVAEYLFLRCTS